MKVYIDTSNYACVDVDCVDTTSGTCDNKFAAELFPTLIPSPFPTTADLDDAIALTAVSCGSRNFIESGTFITCAPDEKVE